MSQLAFAIDFAPSAAPTPTPAATGRAVRSPDRRPQQVQEQQPPAAVDFTQWLSPAEMRRARAYAEEVVRQMQQRPAFLRGAVVARVQLLRRYAAGLLLAGGKVLELAERIEAAGDAPTPKLPAEELALDDLEADLEAAPAPAPVKRAPARPPTSRDPRSPRASMPPQALRARSTVESKAPVPAGPRKQQPTAAEVIANYRGLKAPRRAGSAE